MGGNGGNGGNAGEGRGGRKGGGGSGESCGLVFPFLVVFFFCIRASKCYTVCVLHSVCYTECVTQVVVCARLFSPSPPCSPTHYIHKRASEGASLLPSPRRPRPRRRRLPLLFLLSPLFFLFPLLSSLAPLLPSSVSLRLSSAFVSPVCPRFEMPGLPSSAPAYHCAQALSTSQCGRRRPR